MKEPSCTLSEKDLNRAAQNYPDAEKEIAASRKIVKGARWRNFVEVRQVFKDADAVKGYVIFNIRQNHYCLVTIIHYSREKDRRLTEGHVYIRSFLAHKEYDFSNWVKGFHDEHSTCESSRDDQTGSASRHPLG